MEERCTDFDPVPDRRDSHVCRIHGTAAKELRKRAFTVSRSMRHLRIPQYGRAFQTSDPAKTCGT